MPVVKNPGAIKTGPGKVVLTPSDRLALLGVGMAGAPPNIGQPGYYPPDSVTPRPGSPAPLDSGGSVGLSSHIDDPVGAHDASAISVVPDSQMFFANNLQEAIDEVASGVAVRPPMLGQSFPHMSFSGIPDWGSLKLYDTHLVDSKDEYPYYHTYPSPTSDWTPGSSDVGNDPRTDAVWNGGTQAGLNGLPGTGLGLTKSGAFTNASLVVNRTRALALQISMANRVIPVVVSGSVFPADRGVLAIIHWPATDTVPDFLLQTPLQRVVAAIVLGSGASGGSGGCITGDSVSPINCDGSPGTGKLSASSGSIFSVGVNAGGDYDPFYYPGQAGGQYDLHEINTGFSDHTSEPLPGLWGTAWTRIISTNVTGAGQVRWGTDATIDASFDPLVSTPYGIPVLGASEDAYTPVPGGPVTVVNPFGGTTTYTDTIGSTIATSTNFFRYRLPYLKDYSQDTGLKYTPRGMTATSTRETKRYFNIAPAYDSSVVTGANLTQAGNYDDFSEDHWAWQVARYRHSFYIPGSDVTRELGTYWMIHFKREQDFEAFTRDGKMPWDPSPDGYEVYGVTPVDTSAISSDNNMVNDEVGLTGDPGTGPAPDYGYGSKSYHILRSSLIAVDNTTPPLVVDKDFEWSLNGAGHAVMYVSGIAYFVPLNAAGGWGFNLSDVNLVVDDSWTDFYRTDDNDLTLDSPPAAPARLSSPCPAFMGIAPFSYETTLTVGSNIDSTVFGSISPRYQRLESPFQFLGSNGGGVFSDVNGPLTADQMSVTSLSTGINFPGDTNYPAFSENAIPRVFIRRPLSSVPIQPEDAIQGNGIALVSTGAVAAANILFHSTGWNPAAPAVAHYGNFLTGAPTSPTYASLATATKDTEERFLDETYRYKTSLAGDMATTSIDGPGLGPWVFGPVSTPVQIGVTTGTYTDPFGTVTDWKTKSFVQTGQHLNFVSADSLQVTGFPTRNPSYPSNTTVPFPSAGVLLHPQTDYSTGFVPDNTVAGGGLVAAQHDYSALVPATRSYIRCFDASFVRGLSPTVFDPGVSGQPFVVLRIDGLTIDDFVYTAPGWGGLGDGLTDATYTGIAIMVKVPGLTTWMDLGRVDGDGPSKQDPILDGAGCMVLGPNTFNSVDPVTGMMYCQVRVNVGPMVNLANGQESSPGSGIYEVPVLVKVVMNDLAKDYNLKEVYTGAPGQFNGVITPGAAPDDVRGLCGIKVVHPTMVEIAP